MTSIRPLESQLHAVPLALLLRSASDRGKVGDGLNVSARKATGGASPFDLTPTPSGHWVAHHLRGLKIDVAQDPARWLVEGRAFDFSIEDRERRYLPMRFSAPLPRRNALVWPGWAGVNRARIAPLLPPGSGPSFVPDFMPVFPSSSVTASRSAAQVLAHLAVRDTGGATRPACWALMTVSFGTEVVGIGLSDARGAIVVSFGNPPMPSQTPAQAAAGRATVTWPLQIRVYCSDLGDADRPDQPPPDFADIIAQLETSPRFAMATIQGAQPALGDQTLTLGEPLVLRTRTSPTQFASSLFLKPV
jgi:hypothetical protein